VFPLGGRLVEAIMAIILNEEEGYKGGNGLGLLLTEIWGDLVLLSALSSRHEMSSVSSRAPTNLGYTSQERVRGTPNETRRIEPLKPGSPDGVVPQAGVTACTW